MSGEPRVLADGATDAVYVAWGNCGPVYKLTPGGDVTEQLREPAPLKPMITEDATAEWAIEQLRGVKLPKAARVAVAEALGVDVDDLAA